MFLFSWFPASGDLIGDILKHIFFLNFRIAKSLAVHRDVKTPTYAYIKVDRKVRKD